MYSHSHHLVLSLSVQRKGSTLHDPACVAIFVIAAAIFAAVHHGSGTDYVPDIMGHGPCTCASGGEVYYSSVTVEPANLKHLKFDSNVKCRFLWQRTILNQDKSTREKV